jgi:superfamily I DNA and/or RNA helicase
MPRGHFRRLLELLELESQAEAQQMLVRTQRLSAAEAERTGNSLTGLVVRDEYSALGGRSLLTLGKRDIEQFLPWNRLGVGTPVLLSEEQADGSGWRGVVSFRDERAVQVAFERYPEPVRERPTFRLDLSNDEAARQRQRAALEQVDSIKRGPVAELREVLLGNKRPEFRPLKQYAPLDPSLNGPQQEAVQFALGAEHLAVIHGPPGTGKTTTVAELIRQAAARGERVLACAPSNLAVDNLLERLVAADEKAVRLGHPARVMQALQEHTLDLLVDAHPDVRLARKLVREARALRDKASKYTRAKPARGAKREMRAEARELLADARRMEQRVVNHILDTSTVVCATLTGLDEGILGDREFDLAVIDEAAQAVEPACWIPLLRCRRVVLAGDHCQLPPTVLSTEAARQGFGVSLMERLVDELGLKISRRLVVQYRMHEAIMGFSSAEFYESTLVADDSVRLHTLADLPEVASRVAEFVRIPPGDQNVAEFAGISPTSDTESESLHSPRSSHELRYLTRAPLEFIDTAGAGYDEELEPDGESRLNRQEAQRVGQTVHALLEAGMLPGQIAVIAPYAAQARLLRDQLKIPGLEVDTVDGFQGREKEAVVISLVRSNPQGEIGFLADVRRMNVALTRARRKLIVIADSATISSHPVYRHLVEYFEHHDAYHTVWQLP